MRGGKGLCESMASLRVLSFSRATSHRPVVLSCRNGCVTSASRRILQQSVVRNYPDHPKIFRRRRKMCFIVVGIEA